MSESKNAVVLLSGGLDSATAAALARDEGFTLFCLSFHYGQLQDIEVEKARHLADFFGARRHLVLNIDMGLIGGSALTDRSLDVPKTGADLGEDEIIPVTYVPARNIIFLAYAASWAEVVGARDIFIGVNALDYSGYPDCRPEFLAAFTKMANLGTRSGNEGPPFQLHAPLIAMSKKEIIQAGIKLGVDYSMTHSCYDPVGELACGSCDACLLAGEGDEGEAPRAPGLPVGGDVDLLQLAVGREYLAELVLGGIVGNSAHEQLGAHRLACFRASSVHHLALLGELVTRGLAVLDLVHAVPTADRLAWSRFERYFGLGSAQGAGGWVHLALGPAPSAAASRLRCPCTTG